MNTKHTDSHLEFATSFNQSTSRLPVSFRIISEDHPDYWTALINAFLVVCMLAALAICSWQVEDWNNAQTAKAQPAVANQGFSVKADRTF